MIPEDRYLAAQSGGPPSSAPRGPWQLMTRVRFSASLHQRPQVDDGQDDNPFGLLDGVLEVPSWPGAPNGRQCARSEVEGSRAAPSLTPIYLAWARSIS